MSERARPPHPGEAGGARLEPAGGTRATACLDANQVQAYLRGGYAAETLAGLEAHIDGCDECRALVAAAAALAVADAPMAATAPAVDGDDAPPLEPGARLSRYVIVRRIGHGAMGDVYAAEDEKLRRLVAIKLLLVRDAGADAAARLGREAQALARMSHPNVVSVFDVGTHGDRLFLAMELVEGSDLRAWLSARPRKVSEIVDAFVAAGRGLAAAHAAGLVHRDFKPENVFVGDDGRVRVGDFGLARRRGEPGEDQDLPATSPPADLLRTDLTRSRALVGTPAYMAPEQLGGGGATASSDQFAFCVALYEALYGQRPFADDGTLGDLRRAIIAGRLREEPRGSAVPPSLRRILLRGLAPRPADRFPSMEALLASLTRDRARGPRRVALVATALLLVAIATLVADGVVRRRAAEETRAQLTAAGQQLGRALALRYQGFTSLAQVASSLPAIREVAGNADRAEFGFGDRAADRSRFALLHENLASADWSMWTRGGESVIAVGDYKGRLVFSTAAPHAAGNDLRRVDAVARAYQADREEGVSAMVISARDPALREAGLIEGTPQAGVLIVLAGALVTGGTPRAVLAQTIDGRQLLDDVSAGGDTQMALLTAGGTALGSLPVPPPPAAETNVVEAEGAGGRYAVLRRSISDPAGRRPIATVVLARRLDAGLDDFVRHGRFAVELLVGLLAACAIGAAARARGVQGAGRVQGPGRRVRVKAA